MNYFSDSVSSLAYLTGTLACFPTPPSPCPLHAAKAVDPGTRQRSAVTFKELWLINYCTGEEEDGLEGLVQGCETLLLSLLSSVRRLFREVSSQSICTEYEEEPRYASSGFQLLKDFSRTALRDCCCCFFCLNG